MAVFDDVHYILSSSIPAAQRKELSGLLDLNGATSAPPHTHLIALAGSHTQHEHAGSLHIVSGMWVQRSIVLGKLQLEQYYSPDPTMIFSGIVACATDLSPSDLEVLSAGITSLGGQWRTGLTRDVTHLFALHEQSDKYQTAMHFAPHTHMSVLTPHWFDDSGPYLWPDPKDEDDLEIGESGKKKRKKSSETRLSSPMAMEEAERREGVNVWAGRRLLLSRSLELGQGHREAVEANIQRAGGTVVKVKGTSTDEEAQENEEATLVDECDVFVTRYRSGKAYFKAARSPRPILIGNLTWMFHVDASGMLNDPHESLLWYPVPRGGIPGLNECEITVTNYTGAARDYLKKLIQVMGARFTPSMSQSNKVLVAGYSPSPKTQRAVAWSIPIVNHTWLEDCFIAWKNLTVGVDKYILFPPGVDFGKMLMTPIGGTRGPVPGGRGVGPIDIDSEEQRDAEYRRGMVDEVGPITSSRETPRSNAKAMTTSSKSKPKNIDDGGSSPSKTSQPVASKPKRNALTASQATDMSTRDTRNDKGDLSFDGAGDIAASVVIDVDDEHVSPSKALRQQRSKPKPKSSENKKSSSQQVTLEEEDGMTNIDDGNSRPTKPRSRKRSRTTRENTASDDVVEVYEGGVTDGVKNSREVDEESSADVAVLTKAESKAGGKSNKLPTSKEKTKPHNAGHLPPSREHSNSESASTRASRVVPGSSTPVQTGMKPKPKPKETPQRASSLSDDDEIFVRPVKHQSAASSAKVRTKEPEKEPPTTSAKAAKEKQNARARSPSLSTTRSPSPPVKILRTPKRTVSVLVPSLPKDYLSPSSRKDTSTNKEGRSELTRTNSIQASAAEASTSGSKRGRPSLSKPSTSTPPVKNKSKSKARNQSESEHEDEVSVVLDTYSSRGLPKRSAANKATSRLRDEIMPDVVSFEKERKNAKRRHSSGLNDSFISLRDKEVEEERDMKKRKVEKARAEDTDNEVEVGDIISSSSPQTKSKTKTGTTEGKGTKRRAEDVMSVDEDEPSKKKGGKATQNKKGSRASDVATNQISGPSRESGAVRVMTTGIQLTDDTIKRLNKLGAKMTTKPNDCTHLVAKGIVRTEKFLCAIASSPFVLTEGWVIRACELANFCVTETDFLISDPESERKWNFKLTTSLERAKREDGGEGLLKGMTFYVTPKVEIDLKLLKAVIASAGGQVQTSKPTTRILKANRNRHVISCPADQSIWRPLVEEGYTIYSTELILLAVLTQEIRWKDDNCISSKPSL
ncbi:uncharacterized protein F5891DRAFT_1055500 [Suillus fuscotomentosus]|uniref:BRCT domain-containing protein n=1 Tax=Suillus fuscotomentosus TaxID=1912939 RepID=A0AAD4HGY5_9AGAM|nr:uncharacterized protein F5891DRAFT_1055500 [Suillus fuscotomentosus]KAG1896173.1 hypothetical protein F5891DRAFT_1055500 [Suillus fuscotomentosus]